MRLIDAEALEVALHNFFDGKVIDEPAYILRDVFCHIDSAPAVEPEKAKESEIIKAYTKGFDTGVETVKNERPQVEREFIEILAQYVPDDLCTYPEYRGKPYYSIHYKENGEEFVGFGTYNPEVLSRYLKDYFLKGGAV